MTERRLSEAGGVVLYGPLGMGKSVAIRGLAARARGRGLTVLSATTGAGDGDLPFGTLTDLLSPVPDSVLDELPRPQRTAVRSVLRREPMPPAGADPLALRLGVLGALRAMGAANRVLLVVDGAQWVDRASAELLGYAARRLDGVPVSALVAERAEPADGPSHGGALCPGQPVEIELPPLDLPELSRLLARRGGRTLPHWMVRQINEHSAGNPLFALEIVRAIDRLDRLPSRDEPLPVPNRLRAGFADRLDHLSPAERDVLTLTALAARPGVRLLCRAADAAAETHIATLAAARVLEVDGDALRFTHPLLGAAVRAECGAEQRRAAHDRLAKATADPVERARHLALAHQGPDETLASMLVNAAEHARRRGAAEVAATLARLAVERTPPTAAPERVERCLAAAEYAYAAANYELTRQLAQRALSGPATATQRVQACLILLTSANQDMHGLHEVFSEAFRHVGDDTTLRARLHYMLAMRAHINGDSALARVEAARAGTLARRAGDHSTELVAAAAQAFIETLQGRAGARDVLDRALSRPQDTGPSGGHNGPRHIKTRLDLFADRLAEAHAELDDMIRRARQRRATEDLIFLLSSSAEVDARAGRCQAALAQAHEALALAREVGSYLGPALYAAAVAEAAGGDLPIAEAYAAEGVEVAESEHDLVYRPLALCVLGHARLRSGDPLAAVGRLRQARAIATQRQVVDPAPVPWPVDLAEALIAVGEHDQARELIREVAATARELGRRGVHASLLRANALHQAVTGDLAGAVDTLRQAATAHAEVGLPIEHGRDLLALGVVELRRRHPSAALSAWRQARGLFQDAGAKPWLEQAQRELARLTGAQDRPGGAATLAYSLTATEHRVASMVADGATNREVAAALFLSIKTVESTLTRVYRKLGVRSRTELVRFQHGSGEAVNGLARRAIVGG